MIRKKWKPGSPRDKREAVARRSCSNNKLAKDGYSKKSHPSLAGRPARHQIRRNFGRSRNLHQDGLSRRSDFDSAFLESTLHAAVELALHRPAAAVGASNL